MHLSFIKKKLLFAVASYFLFAACNQPGSKENKPVESHGKDTVAGKKDTPVSISGFWIDSSEINSNEYKEYHWDSAKKSN